MKHGFRIPKPARPLSHFCSLKGRRAIDPKKALLAGAASVTPNYISLGNYFCLYKTQEDIKNNIFMKVLKKVELTLSFKLLTLNPKLHSPPQAPETRAAGAEAHSAHSQALSGGLLLWGLHKGGGFERGAMCLGFRVYGLGFRVRV